MPDGDELLLVILTVTLESVLGGEGKGKVVSHKAQRASYDFARVTVKVARDGTRRKPIEVEGDNVYSLLDLLLANALRLLVLLDSLVGADIVAIGVGVVLVDGWSVGVGSTAVVPRLVGNGVPGCHFGFLAGWGRGQSGARGDEESCDGVDTHKDPVMLDGDQMKGKRQDLWWTKPFADR